MLNDELSESLFDRFPITIGEAKYPQISYRLCTRIEARQVPTKDSLGLKRGETTLL